MINASSEIDYLYRGLRALVAFRAQCALAWLRKGHFVRTRAIRAYLAETNEPKLHLAATRNLDGWLNSQIMSDVPIDITRPLPLPDGSFGLVYSSHLVEHIQRRQFQTFLRESRRILRPGGMHIIATPSAERIARTVYGPESREKSALLEHGARFYPEGFNSPGQQLNLTMRAFGHRYLYDIGYMRPAALAAGYASAEVIDNFALPDPVLATYVRSSKSSRWAAETETFLLTAP